MAPSTITTIGGGKSVDIGSKTPMYRRSEAFNAYTSENKTKVVFTVNKPGGLFPTPRTDASMTPLAMKRRKGSAETLTPSAKKVR